jgi:hypothetical protein
MGCSEGVFTHLTAIFLYIGDAWLAGLKVDLRRRRRNALSKITVHDRILDIVLSIAPMKAQQSNFIVLHTRSKLIDTSRDPLHRLSCYLPLRWTWCFIETARISTALVLGDLAKASGVAVGPPAQLAMCPLRAIVHAASVEVVALAAGQWPDAVVRDGKRRGEERRDEERYKAEDGFEMHHCNLLLSECI